MSAQEYPLKFDYERLGTFVFFCLATVESCRQLLFNSATLLKGAYNRTRTAAQCFLLIHSVLAKVFIFANITGSSGTVWSFVVLWFSCFFTFVRFPGFEFNIKADLFSCIKKA
jgi:hypothetical protein